MAQEAAGTVVNADGHAKTFPPLDPNTFGPQLVWLALTFGMLFLLVHKLILPRVEGVLKARCGRILGDQNRAEELKGEMESALADYERATGQARVKAAAIVEGMRQEFLRELDRERARQEAEIAATLLEAEKRIAASKAKAMAAVQDMVPDISNAIVARLTGTEPTQEEPRRTLPSAAE